MGNAAVPPVCCSADAAGERAAGADAATGEEQVLRQNVEDGTAISSSGPVVRFADDGIVGARKWRLPRDGHLTVLMFGMTGAGKSSLGNLISGTRVFEVADDTASVTNLDSVLRYEAEDGSLLLLDTIGLGDTEIDQDKVVASIRDTALSAPGGIDVLLFVMRHGRVTDDTIARLIFITEYLWGKECFPNLYTVITGASRYLVRKDEAVQWIEKQAQTNWRFKHIYDMVGNDPKRFIFVDNPDPMSLEPNIEQRKAASFAAIMKTLVLHPRDTTPPFTHSMMKKAQQMTEAEFEELQLREEEIRKLDNQGASDCISESTAESAAEAASEEATELPAEAPAEAPSEAPAEAPSEAPAEASSEAQAEAPAEASAEALAEASAEAPAQVPAEAQAEAPAEAPAGEPAEALAEAAVEAPGTPQSREENNSLASASTAPTLPGTPLQTEKRSKKKGRAKSADGAGANGGGHQERAEELRRLRAQAVESRAVAEKALQRRLEEVRQSKEFHQQLLDEVEQATARFTKEFENGQLGEGRSGPVPSSLMNACKKMLGGLSSKMSRRLSSESAPEGSSPGEGGGGGLGRWASRRGRGKGQTC